MSPKPSPLLGYNNNVRHRGRVFHIQTEDSGVRYGHIITHLFIDGGRILKSVKTSYAAHIANERRTDIVREMMKQQHKAMFVALRDGTFDAMMQGSEGGDSASERRGAEPSEGKSERTPSAPPIAVEAEIVEHMAAAPPTLRGAPEVPPPPPALGRDRSAAAAVRTPASAAAKRSRGGSNARAAEPKGDADAPTDPTRPPAAPIRTDHRYAATRPASVFGQARPQQGKSVFGEDLRSDKSLDDAILSYLSNDPDDDKS